ncbi:MFS domain-containing histidine kinase [Reichenbachiella agarivorans]|uniref:histidine kinase n=1 Tax=Reichenbachiella agarivorans TaxID=2979464 RepID=A0ABY6CQ11_9BACT|nr:MFS domain-containing histidine kinase [Reichenbachiella agarivorans]UXP31523.1 MFS domain-containing histidine kinase [Reichenbachiella agarivorans]
MKIASAIDFFIHPVHFSDSNHLRHARLFVRACWLTSLFSSSYVWMSMFFEYDKGVYLMVFNVTSFLLLPLLSKTKLPISISGNIFVFVGAFAILILAYFSGGVWSALYPWIISIPVLALLVVNRTSGLIWGAISFFAMLWFGYLAYNHVELPVEYNVAMRTEWYISVLPGLLLIVLFIAFVFESIQAEALKILENKNEVLRAQKETIGIQSTELQKLIDEKEYIIRILAHDLKNPLSNITSLAEFIQRKYEPDQNENFINLIHQSSVNAQNLIMKVLEMDASGQGDLMVNNERIQVASMLSNLIQLMRETGRKKAIDILLDNQLSYGEIEADKIYLTLVFENLLSNAIKFSYENTKVIVVLSNIEDQVLIQVIDQGPGIQEEEQDRLFKKFSKLSARPTAGESSAGIGLSLVKRYVELMQGKVWYEDAQNGGSIFAVSFPIKH